MSKRSYMMINDENSPPCECGNKMKKFEEEVQQMKNLICELHKLLEKAFPKSTSLDIFPIKSVEEMEHFEENTEMFPKNDVICSNKECIGSTSITKSLQFIITEECLLEYNWDGLQKKKSLKKPTYLENLCLML
ncbi:uncharacterized protein LOC125775596 [Bactrocera dorsalis]|uniref:Uncharacterized protein LOC125775596 n=1 Tax=Bactrocera dorsalis TaxID=27457 RepID=A0ABM3IYY9_BACDO|nr:uncharacterized protein LOC125775596 [Bactrocera dorsalis]XP_049302202.1 uncharacterized protein LOC125775596 [Bactrocera dorsalis]